MWQQYRSCVSSLWKGKSVTRSFLQWRLAKDELAGVVLDVGGRNSDSYLAFMPRRPETTFKTIDPLNGDEIDFESDLLPFPDAYCDTVLFLNVMEHIYNYNNIVKEVIRVTRPDGKVIGFVPFLMWYHPDHEDYFRYTHAALEKIFGQFTDNFEIEPLESGPFIAGLQMRLLAFPRIVRPVLFTISYVLDRLAERLTRRNAPKYVLGYYFHLRHSKLPK